MFQPFLPLLLPFLLTTLPTNTMSSEKPLYTVGTYYTKSDPKGHKPTEQEMIHIHRKLRQKKIFIQPGGYLANFYEDDVVIKGPQVINMNF